MRGRTIFGAACASISIGACPLAACFDKSTTTAPADAAIDAPTFDVLVDTMTPDASPDASPDSAAEAATDARADADAAPPFDAGVRYVDDAGCVAYVPACPGRPNLLQNASFEMVPDGGASIGMGFVPPPWTTPGGGADTYSNDGTWGLNPADYGNFPDAAAYDGIRWVAGWAIVPEWIAQPLAMPLTPGNTYRIEAWLHRSMPHPDPGGYSVLLADSTAQTQVTNVGRFCDDPGYAWGVRSFSFVAPSESPQRPVIVLSPVGTFDAGTNNAYPGIDAVLLQDVTNCP